MRRKKKLDGARFTAPPCPPEWVRTKHGVYNPKRAGAAQTLSRCAEWLAHVFGIEQSTQENLL